MQTLRVIQSMYYDIGAYDMLYSEFRGLCREALSKKLNFFFIDVTKKKNEGKNCILIENKNTCIECAPETEDFH